LQKNFLVRYMRHENSIDCQIIYEVSPVCWEETKRHGIPPLSPFQVICSGIDLDELLESMHPNQLDRFAVLYPVFFTFLLIFIPLGGLNADPDLLEAKI